MKIQCPNCKSAYNIQDKKLSLQVFVAACKSCGRKMTIDPMTGTVKPVSGSEHSHPVQEKDRGPSQDSSDTGLSSPSALGSSASRPDDGEPYPTVSSLSPEYPKYRDPLIICILTLIVLIVLAGGYFMTRRAETVFQNLTRNPVTFLTKLIGGYQTYQVCESFLLRDKDLPKYLGRDMRFSLVTEEIRVVDRRKTARVLIRAQGRADKGEVLFFLVQQGKKWRIVSVTLRLRKGESITLYPKAKSSSPNRLSTMPGANPRHASSRH